MAPDGPEGFASQSLGVPFLRVPFSRCLPLARGDGGCFDLAISAANRDPHIRHPTPQFKEGLASVGRGGEPRADLKTADLDGHRVGISNGLHLPDGLATGSERHPRTLTGGPLDWRVALAPEPPRWPCTPG